MNAEVKRAWKDAAFLLLSAFAYCHAGYQVGFNGAKRAMISWILDVLSR